MINIVLPSYGTANTTIHYLVVTNTLVESVTNARFQDSSIKWGKKFLAVRGIPPSEFPRSGNGPNYGNIEYIFNPAVKQPVILTIMFSFVLFIFASYLLCVQSFESEEAIKKYRSKWRRLTNATMVQIGANGGQEMQWGLSLKHPHLSVIGVECLFRAYVKLVEMFEDEPRATLINACAGESTGLLALN